jgi:hypothetical protein
MIDAAPLSALQAKAVGNRAKRPSMLSGAQAFGARLGDMRTNPARNRRSVMPKARSGVKAVRVTDLLRHNRISRRIVFASGGCARSFALSAFARRGFIEMRAGRRT